MTAKNICLQLVKLCLMWGCKRITKRKHSHKKIFYCSLRDILNHDLPPIITRKNLVYSFHDQVHKLSRLIRIIFIETNVDSYNGLLKKKKQLYNKVLASIFLPLFDDDWDAADDSLFMGSTELFNINCFN